jgi:predicted chitinase
MFPGKVGDRATVQQGLPSLLTEMVKADITTPPRIAAFLATIAHESEFLYNAPQRNATSVFKGRGYIQLTGSGNYSSAGKYLGVDLLGHPDVALELEWSAKIARWYWTVNRRCNDFADALDMGRINAAIGYPVNDGKEDRARCEAFTRALRYLTGTVPVGMTTTRPNQAPSWTGTDRLAQWPVDGYLVNNNVHNPAEAGAQSIHVYGPRCWYVEADHSRTDVRPGSIKSYPDTQRNFDRAIDSFSTLTSTFSMTNPPVGEWNAAYDIWINGFGSKSTAEVMIWTDHRYPASIPPKNATEHTKVTFDGQSFTAWWRESHPGGRYIALVMDTKTATGSVDLLKVLRWLVSKGWVKGSDKVSAVEYGVEIANTGGGPQTFRLNDFTLTAD